MGIQSFSSEIGGTEFIIFACDGGILEQQTLISFMHNSDIEFKPLVGSYQMETGETIQEASFLVACRDFGVISSAGFTKNQESFLHLGRCNSLSKRPATLLVRKGHVQDVPLGLFQSVPEEEAKADANWTYSPEHQTYFICK